MKGISITSPHAKHCCLVTKTAAQEFYVLEEINPENASIIKVSQPLHRYV